MESRKRPLPEDGGGLAPAPADAAGPPSKKRRHKRPKRGDVAPPPPPLPASAAVPAPPPRPPSQPQHLRLSEEDAPPPPAPLRAAGGPAGVPAGGKKAAKRAKLLASQLAVAGVAAVVTPSVAVAHPFQRDPADDAETPFESYRDIEPLLARLAQLTPGVRDKAALRVYDPYFCAGSVVSHLGRLGFPRVHNVNVDCYAAQRECRVPEFDVLVTNPPFSGAHLARALEFAGGCGKPFFMLAPDFLIDKP